VELQLKQGEVHVYLAHENQLECPCAECGARCALYDHQAERQWRHLDTCQYRTILHAAPPRSQCCQSRSGAQPIYLSAYRMLWRRRFNSGGLAAVLEDRPRSGRPKQISAEQEAAIVKATMKTIPKDATHWSVRALAASQNSTIQGCG